MCGLFGVVCSKSAFESIRPRVERAHRFQQHRGPDMRGEALLDAGADRVVYLAHQRLSILDLSEAGRQPMADGARTSWLAYNGEVYNYLELAAAMGFSPAGGSDTEVVLEHFRREGVEASLPKFNGMWGLAWVSTRENVLYLARDRAGVKPLYTAQVEGSLYFASEIKTLLALTSCKYRLNGQVVGEYLVQALQDTSEATFFEGIEALPAGSYARIALDALSLVVAPVAYWSPFEAENAREPAGDMVGRVRDTVLDAVRLRLRADVPVGVMLSGGVDSSVIAACVKQISPAERQDIAVLSAVSPGRPGDESPYIDRVAHHLGIAPIKVDTAWGAEQAIELLRTVTWANDTPLGSFSNVAFYLLMQRAAESGIKVVLSGQGADELFCGYRKYLGFHLQELARQRKFAQLAGTAWSFARNGVLLGQFNLTEARRYLRRTQHHDALGEAVRNVYKPQALGLPPEGLAWRQWLDYRRYSVPYLTHYEDRASMAFAREVRLPFLDYRLVELMLNAPTESKLYAGWTKYALRQAFADRLPSDIIWRRDKQGFSMPQEEWLRGELKPAWLAILNPDAQVFQRGLLDYSALRDKFETFCARQGNIWYRDIFAPLALEIWLQAYTEFIE
jgi:asparagine synthase (glutamine-hydrolysing)